MTYIQDKKWNFVKFRYFSENNNTLTTKTYITTLLVYMYLKKVTTRLISAILTLTG